MPKVSVIIPIYNVEKYLRQALDSVVNQTLKDIEIVCIEDCSTDNSCAILDEYAQKDDRFVVIKHTENKGIGIARNDGLKIAKGEYVIFVDPDDWIELETCEKAYNQISKNGDDVLFFNSKTIDEKGNIKDINKKLEAYSEHLDGKTFSLKEIKDNFVIKKIAVWTRMYGLDFLRRNNIFFPEYKRSEDIIFSMKVYLSAEKVSVLNLPLYNYRQLFSSYRDKELNNIYDAYNAIEDSYKLVKQVPDNMYILKNYIVYFIDFIIFRYGMIKDCSYAQGAQVYSKSRELIKYINKELNLKDYYKEIDIIQYLCFLAFPKAFIYNFIVSFIYSDHGHIVFNLGFMKLKIRIFNTKRKR